MITEFDHEINQNLLADEIRLRQVLINVLGNAIKFTENGFIKLTISLEKELENIQVVKFVCEDTGIGIAQEALVHLFEDFYQEDRIGKSIKESGSGLGLAITNSLVKMMGGEIDIKSSVNKGTKIKIKMPLDIYGNELVEKISIESHNNILEGKHVLLAEDNNLNRMLFKLMLNNMKISVDEVENGFDAVEKVFKNKYDLVLMDIQMPVMDGTTALYAIHKKFDDRVPVVALTAAAFKSEVKHMSVLGFSDCITKPIDQKSLEQKLIDFFSNSKSNSEKFVLIHNIVEKNIALISGGDKVQESKLIASLLEEVNMALLSWKESVQTHNWDFAKKILHRQKVMINSIGIDTNPM
jgi:CheY-like chemotaxis protein